MTNKNPNAMKFPFYGNFMAQIFLGLCTTIGVVSGASSAQALSFNFSFSNVEGPTPGTVSGTIDGLNNGNNTGGTPVVVAVTSSPDSQGLGTYTFSSTGTGGATAFTVSGGNITYADWYGTLGAFNLFLGTDPASFTWSPGWTNGGYDVADSYATTISFTPAAGVPFEFTPSLGFALVGLGLGAGKLRQLSKKSKNKI